VAAGLLGPVLATYTAVLLGQTSVPVWARARRRLPAVFAAGAAASAGGLACVVTPASRARPARMLAVGGAIAELAASGWMEASLGDHGDVYRRGRPGSGIRAARTLTLAGAGLTGLLGRRRWAAALGGAALLSGSLCLRLAVWRAGPDSAALTGAPDVMLDGPWRDRPTSRRTSG
jgi:hypothetical protein